MRAVSTLRRGASPSCGGNGPLQIVPWQPALEQFGGKLVQGQVRNYGQTQGLALGQGLGLSMTIGWKRIRSPSLGLGVSLPPM